MPLIDGKVAVIIAYVTASIWTRGLVTVKHATIEEAIMASALDDIEKGRAVGETKYFGERKRFRARRCRVYGVGVSKGYAPRSHFSLYGRAQQMFGDPASVDELQDQLLPFHEPLQFDARGLTETEGHPDRQVKRRDRLRKGPAAMVNVAARTRRSCFADGCKYEGGLPRVREQIPVGISTGLTSVHDKRGTVLAVSSDWEAPCCPEAASFPRPNAVRSPRSHPLTSV
jgi:hypothetical protein